MATSTTSAKVILITGCSSGFGLSLARAFLSHGHIVLATSRNPSKTPSLVSEIESASNGSSWLPLDVTSPGLHAQFDAVKSLHGRIDVLINNAGTGRFGAFEDEQLPSAAHHVFETNFFGVIALTQLVIPGMRANGSGTIVNVSSGIVGFTHPGLSLYAASKWALEGWSSALSGELSAFGIKVVLAVPGDMRTSFTSSDKLGTATVSPSEAYQGTAVEYVFKALQANSGNEAIDPDRAGRRVLGAVEGEVDVGLRLPLGSQPVEGMTAWAQGILDELQKTGNGARSCDFKHKE